MKIFYGTTVYSIDVTNICLEKLMKKNIISIPSGDINRANYFTDPLPRVHKVIIIENNGVVTNYDEYSEIEINTINNTINSINVIDKINDINNKIQNLHSKLKINYGTFNDELPEQKMAVKYLKGTEKVLEIGGNIGRNALIIASIIENNNFVTLESDLQIAKQLTENRDLNNLKFHIESSALSKRKLIQKKWDTIPSDTLIEGYTWVNTITLEELKAKYNIEFDTLVLDCEGAFYYILMDMPEILDNIKLIIMENDYKVHEQKKFVDEILIKNNFYVDYREAGGWGPCFNNFFEVWKK
jgi:FkbM family methyltransferase